MVSARRHVVRCPVKGCPALMTAERVLCRRHWQMLPGELRLGVLTPRPEDDAYCAAFRAVLEWIEAKEAEGLFF